MVVSYSPVGGRFIVRSPSPCEIFFNEELTLSIERTILNAKKKPIAIARRSIDETIIINVRMREFISCAVNSEAGAVISKIQPVYCIFAVDDMCFVPSMFETLTKDAFI